MNKWILMLGIVLGAVIMTSCSDDDDTPAAITVNFVSTELGISSDNTSAEVSIAFSRATTDAGTLTFSLDAGNLTTGENADFYLDLESEDGSYLLDYAEGVESVSFVVYSGAALNITQDETISITFGTLDEALQIGTNSSLTITFGENFVAESGLAEITAGGADFPDQAFFDISKNVGSSVDKYTWDLGFYAGDDNRVVVNNAAYVMARGIEATDLTAVTAEDTLGFASVMSVPNYYNSDASAWIDDQSGDLSLTAFGDIATSASEAKVFIVKRDGTDRNWKKVRVYAVSGGYTLEYADIDATSFSTLTITKDDAYNFQFVDLDNGAVSVEPEKDSWDFMYSTYALRYSYGGSAIPYGFKDYIIINRNSTSVAQVLIADIAYESFTADNVSTLTFSDATSIIGSSWRSGGGPSSAPAIYEDRYYILKDSDGHYYKVQFISMYSTAGERGYLTFNFELL